MVLGVRMSKLSFVPVLLLLVLSSACARAPESPATPDDGQPPGTEKPEKEKIPISEKTSVDPDRMHSLSWWHEDDLIKELGLTKEQTDRMDAYLDQLLVQWGPNVAMRRGAMKRYARALREGKFEESRKIIEDYGKAEAFFKTGGLILKTEVLSELTPQQYELLKEKHPKLIRSRWISSSKLSAKRQGE